MFRLNIMPNEFDTNIDEIVIVEKPEKVDVETLRTQNKDLQERLFIMEQKLAEAANETDAVRQSANEREINLAHQIDALETEVQENMAELHRLRNTRESTMGQNQVILRHQKFTFPRARE